jgi:hypothetical protein
VPKHEYDLLREQSIADAGSSRAAA